MTESTVKITRKNPQSWRIHVMSQWAGLLIGLISLIASIATLPKDLVWGDSPELAASAWILGIPHPTGYPLYMLATRLFQALPIGTILFRAHLFSAFCTAVAAWILYQCLYQILDSHFENRPGFSILPALVAVIAWLCTPIVWSQGRIAEVYSLFALQFVLALWLFILTLSRPRRTLPLLGFLFGTMLVHHRLSIFIIATITLFLFLRFYPSPSTWFKIEFDEKIDKKTVFRFLVGLFIPLLFLLYLPLRAGQHPAIDWYHPVTWSGFYDLLSGKLYSGILTQRLEALISQVTDPFPALVSFFWIGVLPFCCYSVLALAAVWGWIVLCKNQRGLAGFFGLLFILYQGFVFLYQVGDWPVFLLPSLIVLTIPLSLGIADILDRLHRHSNDKFILGLSITFFLIGSLLPLCVRFEEEGGILIHPCALSNYTIGNGAFTRRLQEAKDPSVTEYATRVWSQIPNGAPLITGLTYETADNELNPLLYQHVVENKNPDSPLIGAGFIHLDWYRQQIAQRFSLDLPRNENRMFLSRDIWLETVWKEIIAPWLQRGPVYTTSFSITNPPPKSWMARAEFQYMGMIPIDRKFVADRYAPYIPSGHLYRISLKSSQIQGENLGENR